MANKSKGGGPKTDKGKAISSGNSITHGLTARRWIDDSEQELFDATLEALTNDFNPQSHIEEMLIAKLAESTVRLGRIQRVEDAMFDLASNEAGQPDESIKSLGVSDEKLIQAIYDESSLLWKFNDFEFAKKMSILNELDQQHIEDILGWDYVEGNMLITADHIINECLDRNLSLQEFITRESQSNNTGITLVITDDCNTDNTQLSLADIVKDSHRVSPSPLQEYLKRLAHNLSMELRAQLILKDLEERTQQIKDAAIPDTQKLSLVQRYRTADERQFSKTLGELFEVQKRLNKA